MRLRLSHSTLAAVVGPLLLLAGCGQAGPLYLPGEQPPPASSQSAPQSNTQNEPASAPAKTAE